MTGQPSGWGGRFYSGGGSPLPAPTGAGVAVNSPPPSISGGVAYDEIRSLSERLKLLHNCVSAN